MYILITAATNREIQPAIDFIRVANATPGYELKTLITGIGSVATVYMLMDHIAEKKPDIIIQAGVAGCFTNRKPGEAVTVKDEIFGDMGVWEDPVFKTIFDLGLAGENDPPFINGVLPNPYKKILSLSRLEQVRSISVNEITTRPERIDWYRQKFSPVVESMEGAAFHFVCLMKNVPFLQIRAISNDIGERDKTKWKMKEAIDTLNEKLISFIKELYACDETYFRI